MTGKVPDAGSNREHQTFLGALQTQPLGGARVHKSGQPRSRRSARGAEMRLLCSETATLRGILRCEHRVLTAGDVIKPTETARGN